AMGADGTATEELTDVYVVGTYFDVVLYRLGNLIVVVLAAFAFWPSFFAMFLIGMLAGRKRIFRDVENNRQFLKRALVLAGIVGLVTNFIGAWMLVSGSEKVDYGLICLCTGVVSFGGPVLAVFYVAAFVLVLNKNPIHAAWMLLGAAGRMPLTRAS
ncbi:DUF418 domain-containing protein, partial [Haloferula sp.]|uniref:DUF418 domain-containing protein n=1 Tax=Haloferula sp. TaxID=2497595 RepID=UPI003C77C292